MPAKQKHVHPYIERYFCDGMLRDVIPEPLFQKDASWNGILEPSFHGIGFMRMACLAILPLFFQTN
jgi:hypothetical protein